jgi:hypothetical protein
MEFTPSMGVTHWEREGTWFPRNLIGVGDKKWLTTPNISYPPPEWVGTHRRAFPSRLQAELATGDTC